MNNENDKMKTGTQKPTMSHKVGDAIEKVGEKISDAGAKNLGKKIHDAGDKIEHRDDAKTGNTFKK